MHLHHERPTRDFGAICGRDSACRERDTNTIEDAKRKLMGEFTMMDLGGVNTFVDIQVEGEP